MSKQSKKLSSTALTLGELLPGQMSFFDPEPVVRPEQNVGKFAGIIFASPYAHNLNEKVEHSWQVRDGDQQISASVEISPVVGRKRPTTTTLRVFLALLQIWKHQGQSPSGEVKFSARQLASVVGWRWAGRDTAGRIHEHISVLGGTSITWTFSFLRASGERERKMSDMSLVQASDYFERESVEAKNRFQAEHRVRLNGDLVDNMLAGYVRPMNYEALKQIGNDTALNLYTRIDIYLSKKKRWERRSVELFRDELGLLGKRYEKRFARHAKLKQLVAEVDGAALCDGRIKAWIEETADKLDYKIVATKIPRNTRQNRYRLKPVVEKEEAKAIAEDIIEQIKALPRGGNPRAVYIEYLASCYPATVLYRALSIAKADYQGKVKTTVTQVFVYELSVLIRASKTLTWHRDVGPNED